MRENLRQQFPDDLAILNVALGLEHQAIAAYQAGATSGLLSGSVLDMALSFQQDHIRHRDRLVGFLRRFGGSSVLPREAYDFGPFDGLIVSFQSNQRVGEPYEDRACVLRELEGRSILRDGLFILADAAKMIR